jgi:hypothetical protein
MAKESASRSDRIRRRLNLDVLTPDQRAAVDARRAERQTAEYQNSVARDVEAYRQEFPPARDLEADASCSNCAERD